MEAGDCTQERASREIEVSLSGVRSWLTGKVQPGVQAALEGLSRVRETPVQVTR